MIDDNDYLNILNYGIPSGTISITPHPEDIIDVDPRIIQHMKDRLSRKKNKSRISFNEIELEKEKQKLKSILQNKDDLLESFSSIENITGFEEKLKELDINKKLLYDYSYHLSKKETVDAFDFYKFFVFKEDLKTKKERVESYSSNQELNILGDILRNYKLKHFDALKVTKEIINVNFDIRHLFETRELTQKLNKFLNSFYLEHQ